jgi:hypothetical protein
MIEPPFILHGSSSQHCGSALEMAKAELGSAPAELAGIHRQSSRCQGSPPPPQLCAYACRLSLVLRSTCVRQGCKGWLEFRVRCPTLRLTSFDWKRHATTVHPKGGTAVSRHGNAQQHTSLYLLSIRGTRILAYEL